jgi:CBS domain-containing protein
MTVGKIMSKDTVCVKEDDFITHARQLMRDHFLRGLPVVDESNRVTGILSDQDILNITSTKSNVTVGGYARQCPTITPDMDVLDAASLLLDAKQHRVPVVTSTSDRTLVGILSDADILKKIHPTKKSPKTAGKIMVTRVLTCHPEENVTKVWSNMLEWDYTGIPVVSHTNEAMGMVTRRDIIKAGYARVGLSEAHDTSSGDAPKVEKIMSTPAYTITEDTPIQKAIEMILHYDIGRLTVVNNKRVVGIVDRYDLLHAFMVGTGQE